MNLKNFGTQYVKKQISDCKDEECLRDEILPLLKSQQEMWAQKVNEIICENGYTKKEFSELCGVSRVTVDKWCKGSIPKNRENFLRIGLAANYDLDKKIEHFYEEKVYKEIENYFNNWLGKT